VHNLYNIPGSALLTLKHFNQNVKGGYKDLNTDAVIMKRLANCESQKGMDSGQLNEYQGLQSTWAAIQSSLLPLYKGLMGPAT
jgi:hypothetical protein